MESINTSLLDFKRLDDYFNTTKNNNISNNEGVFLNCLKEAKSNALQNDKNNCLPKDIKLVKTDSKIKSTKDNNILDEEILDELGNINEQLQLFIVNLRALVDNDETMNIEEVKENCVQLFQTLEPIILSKENEYNKFANIELNEEDIELFQTIFDNLSQVKELIVELENDTEKQFNGELVFEIGRQVIEFEQKLDSIINKITTGSLKDVIISNINHQENKSELDNKKILSINEDDTILETNETTVIKGEEKTEIPEEKLESHQFNLEESFKETSVMQIKTEHNIQDKVDEIQSKEIEIPKDEVIKQIIDKGKAIINDEKSEVRIKLKPEILGELVLKIELEKGEVVAKALVDNYKTKELLETNIYQLKEGLEEQGIEIKTFEVQVGSDSDFEKQNRHNEFNKGQKKRIKIKQLDLEEFNDYIDNTIQYGPIKQEGRLDLLV